MGLKKTFPLISSDELTVSPVVYAQQCRFLLLFNLKADTDFTIPQRQKAELARYCTRSKAGQPVLNIDVTGIFSGGALFFTKNLMTFFSRHPLLHGQYYHQLPFLSHLRGCTSPNSAPFLPHISTKMPLKIFFRRPGGGCTCTPCTSLAMPVVLRLHITLVFAINTQLPTVSGMFIIIIISSGENPSLAHPQKRSLKSTIPLF